LPPKALLPPYTRVSRHYHSIRNLSPTVPEQRYSIAGEVLQLPRSNAPRQPEKVYRRLGKIPQGRYRAVGKAVTRSYKAAARLTVAAGATEQHSGKPLKAPKKAAWQSLSTQQKNEIWRLCGAKTNGKAPVL
jgi:hypothetical protein